MNRPGKVTIASALLTFAFTASISGAGPASAQKLDSGTFHDEFSDTIEDFCDVPGLSVDFSSTVDGRFLDRLQGRHSLFYHMERVRSVTTFTNEATGQTAKDISPNTVNKDLHVTDNGDGTFTVIALLTGGDRTLGDNGRLIARNSGQIRLRILVDANGDELETTQIKGSTGTNDDFCAAVLSDWGVG